MNQQSETGKPLTYREICDNARGLMTSCKVCRVCNGEACRGVLPGVGGKGNGDNFVRNYQKLQQVKLHLDTLCEAGPIDTGMDFLGKKIDLPFFAAPLASIENQFGPKYNTEQFSHILLENAQAGGTVSFLPEGNPELIGSLCGEFPGIGIPTIKPWPIEVLIERAKQYEQAGAFAVATDLDGAGLAMVQGRGMPVAPKSVEEIRSLVEAVNIPIIIKGIMTVAGARKCVQAGVAGIVVSNHGGRVLEQALSTIEVLEHIASAAAGRLTVLLDGAVRSGSDLFKIRALGGHGALIGRPLGVAVYGGGPEGLEVYRQKIRAELVEAMMMTGARRLGDICKDMVHLPQGFSV